ncbi:MAG: hypothetical protein JKY66_10830 [Spongiibacteraceae bacterium]|nr:hypothetical protein [Spongiibacteraceae bacterium]
MANPRNNLVPFSQFKNLHVARFVIVEESTNQEENLHLNYNQSWPATLIFLGDCDGPHELFLAELAVRAGPGLRLIFSHCKQFNPDSDILLEWMITKNTRASANYINWIGRTVTQVHEEAELHEILKQQLTLIQEQDQSFTALQTYQYLYNFVRNEIKEKKLCLSKIPTTPLLWQTTNLIHKIGVPLILLLLSPLFLLLSPLFIYKLRSLERTEPEILSRPDKKNIAQFSKQEDQWVTNQFSAFGHVKPGLFRRYTIIFFLFLLNYSSRHIYNKGFLTRVKSIHFARWVLLDNNRRLLFASNYDGSLESYMDDFINKVSWGLNLVFSNGLGYPRSRWLVKDGAEQEQKFKNYLRSHQLYTDVWYKAYPNINAIDLSRNSRIRQGLEKGKLHFLDLNAIREWLSLI